MKALRPQDQLPVFRNPIFTPYSDYRRIYLSGGFFWNTDIAEYLETYGGRVYFFMQGKLTPSKVDFNVKQTVTEGRNGPSKAIYDFAVQKLGEEVCPAGWCHNVQLLLTEGGRLVACLESDFKGWCDAEASWRASVKRLLDGEEAHTTL